MLDFIKFFSKVSEFPCPELFEDELEGFKKLENIWDILTRIQNGFVGSKVSPQILGEVKEGAILDGDDIYIGKGSVVHPGALIKGPTIIGENVEIRHSAFVRGNVIIGDNSIVGHCSEIVRSVMLPGAKAPHFNYVGDSILGTGVNLGAGTKLSNLKNDGTNVKTRIEEHVIDTGIRKFGAILGDNCLLGCNSVTNPGTILGSECRVYPCAVVSGYHPQHTIIKLRQNLTAAIYESI
ncbi:MAG: glucose-1-phosphate thymidylyltransferase [Candidatus Rifleibacteriota bacterium]